jgi:hypothetical protein
MNSQMQKILWLGALLALEGVINLTAKDTMS